MPTCVMRQKRIEVCPSDMYSPTGPWPGGLQYRGAKIVFLQLFELFCFKAGGPAGAERLFNLILIDLTFERSEKVKSISGAATIAALSFEPNRTLTTCKNFFFATFWMNIENGLRLCYDVSYHTTLHSTQQEAV